MTPERLLAEARRPGAGEEIVERLIDEVTIKETYFLRHTEQFHALVRTVVPADSAVAGPTTTGGIPRP